MHAAINFHQHYHKYLPNSQNIDFLFFFDAANVWGVDYDSSLDDGNEIKKFYWYRC